MGIPISVNYTWFIVFFLVTWTLAQSYFPKVLAGYPPVLIWLISVISALLLFITLLAHELSHSVVAIRNKLPIQGITLFIFGGVAHMTKEPQDPKTEFKMAIAGPLCSFALSFIFYVLTQLLYNLKFSMAIIAVTDYISFINMAVGIFNLIPGYPLDGGRILRSALWALFGDIRKATAIASTFGRIFAYMLMGLGFLYLFYGLTLSGIWLILIGFFVQEAANAGYQQVLIKRDLGGMKIKDIMSKNVIFVSGDISLLSLVDDYFFKYRFTSFPVLTQDGAVEGLITIHAVKDVPRQLWHSTKVKDAMIHLRKDLLIHQNIDAYEALPRMASNGVGRLIVTQDHKLIGIISQRDIIRLFEVKEDLGE